MKLDYSLHILLTRVCNKNRVLSQGGCQITDDSDLACNCVLIGAKHEAHPETQSPHIPLSLPLSTASYEVQTLDDIRLHHLQQPCHCHHLSHHRLAVATAVSRKYSAYCY